MVTNQTSEVNNQSLSVSSARSRSSSPTKKSKQELPFAVKKELQRCVCMYAYNKLATECPTMSGKSMLKKLEELYLGRVGDPNYVSLCDKLLGGHYPFDSLVTTQSDVVTDPNAPSTALNQMKCIKPHIHNYVNKVFPFSLIDSAFMKNMNGRNIRTQWKQVQRNVKVTVAHSNYIVKKKGGTINADGTFNLPSGTTLDDIISYVLNRMKHNEVVPEDQYVDTGDVEKSTDNNEDDADDTDISIDDINDPNCDPNNTNARNVYKKPNGVAFVGMFSFFLFAPNMAEEKGKVLECFVTSGRDFDAKDNSSGRKHARDVDKDTKSDERSSHIVKERGQGMQYEAELATANLAAKYDDSQLKKLQTLLSSYHQMLQQAH